MGKRAMIAEGETDSQGYFFFRDISPGSYDVLFISPVAREEFRVEVQGASVFRWFPKNWLEVGLGFVQPEGCSPSYIKANRVKRDPATAQPKLAADR